MDLGDLGGNYQTRGFKELIGCDVFVADDALRVGWIPQTAVRIGLLRGFLAEFIHEGIMFASEEIVVETQTDRPVVGESGGFLSGPLRLDRIAGLEYRQIARSWLAGDGFQEHLRRIFGIALHAPPGGFVISIELGGVPPGSVVVAESLWRAGKIVLAPAGELLGRRVLRH